MDVKVLLESLFGLALDFIRLIGYADIADKIKGIIVG